MVLLCVPGLEPGGSLRTVVLMTGSPLGAHGSLGKGLETLLSDGSAIWPRAP